MGLNLISHFVVRSPFSSPLPLKKKKKASAGSGPQQQQQKCEQVFRTSCLIAGLFNEDKPAIKQLVRI